MMTRFWSNLAVQLGRRVGIVALVVVVLTVGLGFGTTKLEFATGQDSYLNNDEQIAKDNKAYQSLFGGQIMLVMFTLDEGTTLTDMVTGTNQEVFDDVVAELCGDMVDDTCTANPTIKSVVTPRDSLQLAHNLLTRSSTDPATDAALPTDSIAGKALGDAIAEEEPGSGPDRRAKDQDATACVSRHRQPAQPGPRGPAGDLRGEPGSARRRPVARSRRPTSTTPTGSTSSSTTTRAASGSPCCRSSPTSST